MSYYNILVKEYNKTNLSNTILGKRKICIITTNMKLNRYGIRFLNNLSF